MYKSIPKSCKKYLKESTWMKVKKLKANCCEFKPWSPKVQIHTGFTRRISPLLMRAVPSQKPLGEKVSQKRRKLVFKWNSSIAREILRQFRLCKRIQPHALFLRFSKKRLYKSRVNLLDSAKNHPPLNPTNRFWYLKIREDRQRKF